MAIARSVYRESICRIVYAMAAFFVCAYLLVGCSQLAVESARQMKQVSEAISKNISAPFKGESKPDEPLYCYKTLGTPECYAKPLPGQQDRLISYYGPKLNAAGEVETPPPPPETATAQPASTPAPAAPAPDATKPAAPPQLNPGLMF